MQQDPQKNFPEGFIGYVLSTLRVLTESGVKNIAVVNLVAFWWWHLVGGFGLKSIFAILVVPVDWLWFLVNLYMVLGGHLKLCRKLLLEFHSNF